MSWDFCIFLQIGGQSQIFLQSLNQHNNKNEPFVTAPEVVFILQWNKDQDIATLALTLLKKKLGTETNLWTNAVMQSESKRGGEGTPTHEAAHHWPKTELYSGVPWYSILITALKARCILITVIFHLNPFFF